MGKLITVERKKGTNHHLMEHTASVQELINMLEKVEDKSLPVFGYLGEQDLDIIFVNSVDTDCTGRVDINLITSK